MKHLYLVCNDDYDEDSCFSNKEFEIGDTIIIDNEKWYVDDIVY